MTILYHTPSGNHITTDINQIPADAVIESIETEDEFLSTANVELALELLGRESA